MLNYSGESYYVLSHYGNVIVNLYKVKTVKLCFEFNNQLTRDASSYKYLKLWNKIQFIFYKLKIRV